MISKETTFNVPFTLVGVQVVDILLMHLDTMPTNERPALEALTESNIRGLVKDALRRKGFSPLFKVPDHILARRQEALAILKGIIQV